MKWPLRASALAALASLVAEFGFPLSERAERFLHGLDLAIVAVFVLDVVLRTARAPRPGEHLRQHWLETLFAVLIFGAVAVPLATARWVDPGFAFARITVVGAQVYLLTILALATVRANEQLATRAVRPAWLLVGSFLAVILAGTLLLLLPECRAPGAAPWTWLDALFTATSATCVTGLSVRDVGSELSFRGQAVLCALMQVGGLGLVTLAMFITWLQKRRLRLEQMTMVRDVLGIEALSDLGRFLGYALAVTFFAEALGAAVLYQGCAEPALDPGGRAWWSIFHSVSAFCNAGFGLESDSFMRYAGSTFVSGAIGLLVIVGGLGFPVIYELLHLDLRALPFARRRRAESGTIPTTPVQRISVNARIVLAGTAALLVAGTLFFWVCERTHTLADRPASEQALASWFQAAVPRTAGFNSLDVLRFADPTLLLVIVLMVIGASPVSTGGGLKTTTVLLLGLAARAAVRGRAEVEAFGRTIPRRAVNAAVAIALLYAGALLSVTAALAATQRDSSFLQLLFESTSALSTVGLTIGVTAKADTFGRLVLCVAMLVGRVGPLAVLGSVIVLPATLRYQYPEEGVVVS